MSQQQQQSQQLTCTTAPGHVFSSRTELADHYKSDWHAYNMKRRQAGLKLLTRLEFVARLQAAQAARQEQDLLQQKQKQSHLKDKNKKKKQTNGKQQQQRNESTVTNQDVDESIKQMEEDESSPLEPMEVAAEEPAVAQKDTDHNTATTDSATPNEITIDPCQCLYDSHISPSITANVDYMRQHYSWFLPDADYLADLKGLLGYCHEKISIGHMCLQCHQAFSSATGCRQHMLSKQHTQLAYLTADDQEELAVFFDFADANEEFLGTVRSIKRRGGNGAANVNKEDDDEDGWVDVSDDEEMKEIGDDEEDELDDDDDDDDDLYAGYADQVAKMGFSVTALGELVFPDGRIVGHRSLRRYYNQRPRTQRSSTAVAAARLAAGERLYQGRVYNMNTALTTYRNSGGSYNNAIALARLGIAPGLAAGRAGKGILVASGPEGSFSQLSVYRYRAAVHKQRRGEQRGQRMFHKTNLNMNHLDKKHNRIMTGVSVAHAKR